MPSPQSGVVRRPAVAGQFYPDNPARLKADVEDYIASSEVEPAPGKVEALVCPHAGYMFSGPTAGYAFARVRGKQPGRVVLLGCSHRYPLRKASVHQHRAFESPVGTFPIDEDFAKELAGKLGSESPEAHTLEHALEVQLPFVEAAMGVVPIVPVLFGSPPGNWHIEAGETLAAMLDKDDLVIASTDLSHYQTEEQANAIDARTIEGVLSKNPAELVRGIQVSAFSMCGSAATAAAMACAIERGAAVSRLLDYRTSAHASGDYQRVVGYAAISMEHAS